MDLLIIAIGLPLALAGYFMIRWYVRQRERSYNDFMVRHRLNLIINADDQASKGLRRAADQFGDIRAHASRAQ